MIFNSIEFLVFLPLVFILYWFVFNKKIEIQNFLILVASYVFYGWWNWRFLFLIFFSTIIDYNCAIQIEKSEKLKNKKIWLTISMAVNLGLLGFFKYYNFFVASLIDGFSKIGLQTDFTTLNIILPVGISFYTFQTMSYTIDVYKKQLKPTKNFIGFAAFVSFFPQLVAGPIERATQLLPQFFKQRKFEYTKAADGLRQILWGLFKKIVVADNCAIIVNNVFENYTEMNGSSLFIGAIFFSFQIYGDFSGYSDIAIGTARLFGFNLMQNFAFPYFSRDIAEFWRRWHISLSTWFRDYLYIPLGGSKGNQWNKVKNTFIIFLVSGFWHGANWTFIFWGFLNALYFLPLLLLNKNRKNTNNIAEGKFLPSFKDLLKILTTFLITSLTWVFFRAPNVETAFNYLKNIFSNTLFYTVQLSIKPFLFIVILLLVEWIQRNYKHGLTLNSEKITKPIRWSIYLILVFLILSYGAEKQEFIYFQF